MRFDNKVVIVTGSGRGIGKLTAQTFAQNGANVVINDVNKENINKTVTEIKEKGGKALGVATDISDESAVKEMISKTIEEFGRIDILVNNAGFSRDYLIGKMTIDHWDAVINTVLKGSFLCTKYVSPYMIEQKAGKIINISSRAYLGNPGQGNYSAAKSGIIGFTKAMAKELGRFSINVNAVAPGLTETEGLRNHAKYDMIKERALKETPLKRIGEPKDVVNVISFLASEYSSYVTGDVIHVTGGRFG